MVFLAKIGLIDVSFLNRNRKYAILINFIIAAILTPTPDVVNQMMMGVPLHHPLRDQRPGRLAFRPSELPGLSGWRA